MNQTCETCLDLWRKYGIAMTIYIQLDNKLRFAALQGDVTAIESLTRETEGAEVIRSGLRQSIRDHESTHRAASASSTSS